MHASQLAEVIGTSADLPVQAGLLASAGSKLTFHPPNARDHAVEVSENIVWCRPTLERCRGRIFQRLLDKGALLLDGEMGCAEVLVKELVRESNERLVLVAEKI